MTNDLLLARLSSGDELIHPIRTGSSVEVRTHTYTVSQTATLETEICGQRLSTARAAMSHGDGRKSQQTRCCSRKPRECPAILWRRKSCWEARTTRWRTQSCETRLRWLALPGNREKNREIGRKSRVWHPVRPENACNYKDFAGVLRFELTGSGAGHNREASGQIQGAPAEMTPLHVFASKTPRSAWVRLYK